MPNKVAYTSFFVLKGRISQRQSCVTLKNLQKKTKRFNLYIIFHHDMLNDSDHQSILKAYLTRNFTPQPYTTTRQQDDNLHDNLTRKRFIAYSLGKEVFKVIRVLTCVILRYRNFLETQTRTLLFIMHSIQQLARVTSDFDHSFGTITYQ